jgi:predicted RNase H-like nuclease (RuvC/YqgF family)
MCECITDVLLGTLLWLDSPAVVQDLQYRRILADAVAALRPNENLVEKYRNELSKLKDRNEISEREYFYLRSHPKPLGRLEEKTFGDPNAFYDRLPEEILEELRNEIEMGIREETDLEIERQSKRISVLTTPLGNVQGDLKNMQESVDGARQKVERIANAITMGLSVLGSAIVVVLLLVSIHPARLLMWRLLFGVPLAAISALNLIFGFTVRAYFRPLRDRIRDRLLQAIDMD